MRLCIALLLPLLLVLVLPGCPPPPEIEQGVATDKMPDGRPMPDSEPAQTADDQQAGPPSDEAAEAAETGEINWLTSLDEGLAQAKKEKKLVFVDFYADWCGPCKMLTNSTFTDEKVIKKLQAFVTVKIDTDENQALAIQYKVEGIPLLAVMGEDGKVIMQNTGFIEAAEMLEFLDKATAKAKAD